MTRTIPLSGGFVALVDEEDYGRLSQHKWFAQRGKRTTYAARDQHAPARRRMYMHREILGLPDGRTMNADHKNGNGLDNRRENLRVGTQSQNLANRAGWGKTSRYKGVTWNKKRGVWVASVCVNYKHHFLGHFSLEEEAARAYDVAALQHRGEFARLNFPKE